MKLRWTARAERDLMAIGDFIARDNPPAALAWVEKLRERARLAAKTPQAGRAVPKVGRPDVREVFLRTYRIVYVVRTDTTDVLTVFEGHRRYPRETIPDHED